MDKNFVQTNDEFVRIGGIMVKTNSPLNTDEFKQFKWREHQAWVIANSGASNATDLFIEAAWALVRDYPDHANGYQDIMAAIEDYEWKGQTTKARLLANKLIGFSMPTTVPQYFHPERLSFGHAVF